ncbi:MAG: hypothetical protein AAF441_14210 [Pseudomonadota bacterium]
MIRTIALAGLSLTLFASAASAGPNCTCRYQGHNYKIGEIACILGDLKRCEMQLNNTSWQTVSQGCPQVLLPNPPMSTPKLPHAAENAQG